MKICSIALPLLNYTQLYLEWKEIVCSCFSTSLIDERIVGKRLLHFLLILNSTHSPLITWIYNCSSKSVHREGECGWDTGLRLEF